MNVKEKLDVDMAVFGHNVIQNFVLGSFRKRLWGAWKVLTGEAGIILVRVDPEDFNQDGK